MNATCVGTFPSDQPVLQRAFGRLHVAVRRSGEATALGGLRQEGCLKARFPRAAEDGWRGVVVLNSSGGVAGGDDLATDLVAGPGARMSVAAQAAERFYRVLPGAAPARVRTTITVGTGAVVEWLPQESILFDRSGLDRVLTIDLAEEARFLGVECLVFGRTAMGEAVREATVQDRIVLRRAGMALLHDAVRMAGDVGALLALPAVAAGGAAVGTLVLAAPEAAGLCDPLRAALAVPGVEAGVSAWNDLLLGRVVAGDGACLRAAIVAGLAVLRDGRPLPRVWLC